MSTYEIEEYIVQRNMNKSGISWFKFDDTGNTAIDSYGTSVGTLYNGVTRGTGWMNEGYCVEFNGVDQYIQFDSVIVPNNSDFTVRIFIKTTDSRGGIGRRFANTTYNTNGFSLYLYQGVIGAEIFGMSGSVYYNVNDLAKNRVDDGQWHEVLFIFNNSTGTFKLMVDGDEAESLSVTDAVFINNFYNSSAMVLGKETVSSFSHMYLGSIDELEVYNKVLTPEDFNLNKGLIKVGNDYIKFDTSTETWSQITAPLNDEVWINEGYDDLTKPMLEKLNQQGVEGKIVIKKLK